MLFPYLYLSLSLSRFLFADVNEKLGRFLIITWLSDSLLLIELNPSPSPALFASVSLPSCSLLSHLTLVSHSLSFFVCVWFSFHSSSFSFSLSLHFPSQFHSLSWHVSSSLFSLPVCLFFLSVSPLFLLFSPHACFFPSLSFSFSTGLFSSVLPLLRYIYMLSLSNFSVSLAPLLFLLFSLPGSLTPWALWYCCHGDAHHFLAWMEDTLLMRRHGRGREKESDGEKDKDRQTERERETAGRENQNDMEMIFPTAHDTKHFHPVICSALMSQRGQAKQTKARRILLRVGDSRGCWRISPKHCYSSLLAWEVGREIPLIRKQQAGFSCAPWCPCLIICTM